MTSFPRIARILVLVPSVALLAGACGESRQLADPTEAWNADNDPGWFDRNAQRVMGALPLSGDIGYRPWVGKGWPNIHGGLAHRWTLTGSNPWMDPLPSFTSLMRMGRAGIAHLSPAEKLDLLRRDYNYSFTRAERRRVHPGHAGWFGLCHGMAPASLLFQEPQPVVVRNADGLDIPFGSSDLKGLLAMALGNTSPFVPYWSYVGKRCNFAPDSNAFMSADPACRDMNAGAFHVLLANEIGLKRQGFVIDHSPGFMVWNRPVYAFRSQILQQRNPTYPAARGTVRELVVRSRVFTTTDVQHSWWPIGENSNGRTQDDYTYALELDAYGRIVGGKWLTSKRPDFAWKAQVTDSRKFMVGQYSALQSLVHSQR